jgi:hypothetical protein
MTINFKGPAARLTDMDLSFAGHLIGAGEDEIHAVLEVESSGHGYTKDGRPTMRFEPHYFWRLLPADKQARAVREGLAWAKWDRTRNYPANSYDFLARAIAIDETAALKSCSWGLGQIMGEHYRACGYDTVQRMVHDATLSEGKQLTQMVAFIRSKKLDDDLRRHDWHGFAKGYNGARYAEHNYHGRLAAAFGRWQRIKDTPFTIEELRKRAAQESDIAAATAKGLAKAPPPPDIEPTDPNPAPSGWLASFLSFLRRY